MAIGQSIWSLDSKCALETSELKDEKELELFLLDHIELLDKDWLVIGHQVRTNAGKFIDILCMDYDGDLVVVELKRDMTPREVTAQTIDYAASVSEYSTDDIAAIYLAHTEQKETLNDAYYKKYGRPLDDEIINHNVKMVIVAAKMDDGTERIIRYLRERYEVDINILFFNIYKCGEERIISRMWFEPDVEDNNDTKSASSSSWNGEYYVNFGEGDARSWEDACRYGFISAGGGSWYSKTLWKLSKGSRIWVYIPKRGYVGVGEVTECVEAAAQVTFDVDGTQKHINELDMKGSYLLGEDGESFMEPGKEEFIVKVRWIYTVDRDNAVRETGMFAQQNTVCAPRSSEWMFTIERLKKLWGLNDD